MSRIIWLAVVSYAAFAGPWMLAALLGGVYIVKYRGVELLVVAALADAGYGIAYASVPWYTLAATGLLVAVVWLQPFIRGTNTVI